VIGARDGYGVARRNLIRALRALGGYRRDAVVVVGAQAVYIQTRESDPAPFLPFTRDTDIVVDPRILETVPPIHQTLLDHGYRHRRNDPGLYWAPGSSDEQPLDGAAVDILVPEEFAVGKSRRDARIPGDNERAARRVRGLEAALYDKDIVRVEPPDDGEAGVDAFVAGPAALITAKAQKIAERGGERLKAKDASDVFLLLRSFEVAELQQRFALLAAVQEIGVPLRQSIEAVRDIFVAGTRGRTLFSAAVGNDPRRPELLDAFRSLTRELGRAIDVFN
jgi:hypothetical protein